MNSHIRLKSCRSVVRCILFPRYPEMPLYSEFPRIPSKARTCDSSAIHTVFSISIHRFFISLPKNLITHEPSSIRLLPLCRIGSDALFRHLFPYSTEPPEIYFRQLSPVSTHHWVSPCCYWRQIIPYTCYANCGFHTRIQPFS